MFVQENRERLESLLWCFNNFHSLSKEKVPIEGVIERFLNDEIAQEKGWAEYIEYLNEVEKKDKRLLRAIKSVKGNAFFVNLNKALKELGPPRESFPMRLVNKPIGKFVDERYGREIRGYWVNQRSVGTEGDSFEGEIYILIRDNKYLEFHYSC